jgi:alkylhydroperoxidase family enzyme
MTRVPYYDPNKLPDDLVGLGHDPFYGILAHRPEILRSWNNLDVVFFGPTSTVPNAIKEEARRTIAQGAGCRFCASLGEPRGEHPDRREALATAYADLIASDHHQVEDSTFDVLREEFTDEEIVELTAWICFKLGSNIFGALMKLEPAKPAEIAGYADFVAGVPS